MYFKSQQSVALHTAVDKLCSTYFTAIEADRLSVEQTLGTYVRAFPFFFFLPPTAYQLQFSVFVHRLYPCTNLKCYLQCDWYCCYSSPHDWMTSWRMSEKQNKRNILTYLIPPLPLDVTHKYMQHLKQLKPQLRDPHRERMMKIMITENWKR